VGIGSQPLAAKQELETRRRAAKNASHTTPLTVLAELGAVGFLLYLAFLAGAARLLWEAFRRDRVFGLGLAACFLVLLLHSLFYSGFFEDPVMWGVLGVAAMLVARSTRAADPGDAIPDSSLLGRVEARWKS
jgi:4-amino-4-deoxy-L-arabinose transferase-like glycosyltransferase